MISKTKILYIEDDQIQRELITFSLKQQGFDVDTAVNGQEGVQRALTWLPDLILTDLMMPVMDGFQVAEMLRAHPQTQHIPIVALTAVSDDKTQAKIKAVGMNGLIEKTTNLPGLLKAIQRYLSDHLT